MKRKLDKPWKQWTFWTSVTLILAFSLNMAAVWALPYIITDKVSDELLDGLPVNQFSSGTIRVASENELAVDGLPTRIDKVVMDCPDHFVQFCKYDISKKPLHIQAPVPVDAPYWSISFYAHNTDNFWVMNDLDAKDKRLTEVNITLVKKGSSYEKQGEEMVYSPSSIGVILIRTIIPDRYSPEGREVMKELLKYQAEARQ